jgi:hypothetical protein
MKDMLDDIPDENLRKRLENFREEPGPDLWKRISGEMHPDDSQVGERLGKYLDEPDDTVWYSIQSGLKLQKFVDRMLATSNVIAVVSLLFLFFPWSPNVDRVSLPPLASEKNTSLNSVADSALRKDVTPVPRNPQKESGMVKTDLRSQAETLASTIRKDPRSAITEVTEMLDTKENESGLSTLTNASLENLEIVRARAPVVANQIPNLDASPAVEVSTLDSVALDSFENPGQLDLRSDLAEIASRETPDSSVEKSPDHAKNIQSSSVKIKEEVKKVRSGNYRIYSLVMPTFGYQQIKPVTTDDIFIHSIKKISAFSTKRLGIRAEAGLEKEVSERLTLSAGLFYYQRKQTIAYEYTASEQFTVTNTGGDSLKYDVQQPLMSSQFEYEVKNIGLTAGFAIGFHGNRFGQRVGMALELHRSLSSTSVEQPSDPRFYLFSNIYYRVSYKLSERFDAIVQPTFNYALQLDQRIAAPFYVKPYGLGLNVGVYYYLR